jgi:hypothetical protein
MIELPINNQPNQFFRTSIPMADRNLPLNFHIYWNTIAEYWQMTIQDALTGIEYINGLPLLPGESPAQLLLRQWGYFDIGNALVLAISNTAGERPVLGDWGVNFILVWGE